jgi:hypothetical protein
MIAARLQAVFCTAVHYRGSPPGALLKGNRSLLEKSGGVAAGPFFPLDKAELGLDNN